MQRLCAHMRKIMKWVFLWCRDRLDDVLWLGCCDQADHTDAMNQLLWQPGQMDAISALWPTSKSIAGSQKHR